MHTQSLLSGYAPGSNPNQTHMKQLIIVFKTTRRLQAGDLYQGWVKSLQESGLEGQFKNKHSSLGIF